MCPIPNSSTIIQMGVLQVLAFTVPAAATLATLLAQLLLNPKSGASFHPNIGATSSCFLGQHLPQLLYFQAPVLLLLLSNTCFYCRVIYQLTAGIFTCDGESFRNIRISLEFLFVMGLNWIAEVLPPSSLAPLVPPRVPHFWSHGWRPPTGTTPSCCSSRASTSCLASCCSWSSWAGSRTGSCCWGAGRPTG